MLQPFSSPLLRLVLLSMPLLGCEPLSMEASATLDNRCPRTIATFPAATPGPITMYGCAKEVSASVMASGWGFAIRTGRKLAIDLTPLPPVGGEGESKRGSDKWDHEHDWKPWEPWQRWGLEKGTTNCYSGARVRHCKICRTTGQQTAYWGTDCPTWTLPFYKGVDDPTQGAE